MQKRMIIHGLDEVKETIPKLSNPIALDTETTSLVYADQELVGISLCDKETNCYINLYNNPDSENIILFLKKHFNGGQDFFFVMHNSPFDLSVLHKFGVDLSDSRVWDTMTGDHLIDERNPHGLKAVAKRLLDVDVKSFEESVHLGYDNPKFFEYALNDSLWTLQIFDKQVPEINKLGLTKLMMVVEVPYNHVLTQMRVTGMHADMELNKKLIEKAYNLLVDLEVELYSILGKKPSMQTTFCGKLIVSGEYNFDSNIHVANILNELGIELSEKTDTGKDKVDKHVLKKLEKEHKFVEKLVEYRKYKKLYTTYLEPFHEFVEKDGKIRPSLLNTGTKSGRLSSQRPNLQNLPNSKDDDPFQVRSQFVAPPGYTMIAVDFAGQELRILAVLSKDKNMYDALYNNKDLHQLTADGMGISRFKGKIFNFSMAYGKTASGFSKDFGIEEDEAQKLMDKYYETYPGVLRATEKAHNELSRFGYVKTLWGRRRRFKSQVLNSQRYPGSTSQPFYTNRQKRQAFNHKIQGTASDMIRCSSNAVFQLGKENPAWDLKQVVTVHDENVYIIKKKYLEDALPQIKHAFENSFKSKMPFPAELGTGHSYQEAK